MTVRRGAPFVTMAILVVCFYLVGCGPSEIRYPDSGATLEGTVAYGPEKITDALIIAQNDQGKSTGYVGEDGHYKLENVPLGDVNLAVDSEAGRNLAIGKLMAKTKGKGNSGSVKILEVPRKYQDPAKSGMKTTIVNAIAADTSPPLQKVEDACYLILTSSYYNVWH